MKKVLLIINNTNQWGQKHLVASLSKCFDLKIVQTDTRKELDEQYSVFRYTKHYLAKRIERYLSFFINPPKTTNFKYGKRRNFLSGKQTLKKRFYYYLQFFFPNFLSGKSASFFISRIRGEFDQVLFDFNPDVVLNIAFFTPMYPSLRAKYKGYKVYDLIYSWDNPFKDIYVPDFFDKYLVWNNESAEDLCLLHGIDKKRCHVVNPLQFDYLKNVSSEFSDNNEVRAFIENNEGEYYLLLFGCAYAAAEQEAVFFEYIISLIHKDYPEVKFFLRPYPNVPDVAIYDRFQEKKNVFFQKNVMQGIVQDEQSINEKYQILKHAKAVVNIGTTMSLEASFFNYPILQLAYVPDWIKLSKKRSHRVMDIDYVLKNDHLHKYLIKKEYASVAYEDDEVISFFDKLEDGEVEELLPYTAYLNKLANPNKESLAEHLLVDVINGERR